MKTDKIYLVGFMGAGKTHASPGRSADAWAGASRTWTSSSRPASAATVAEIFATRGEPYFRAAEREVLRQLLPPRHVVVATGGGTYADPENRRLINADGAAIWLDLPFDRALERVPADGRRPLAADRQQFEALYAVRRLSYLQAHLRLDARRAPVEELVERILDWLGY